MALARLRADLGARVRSADAIERRPVRVSSGVAALDAVLGGGLARGAMVEATGSGRASLALQAAAAATGRGALVAWVDAAYGFDARSAVRAGVDCTRLLLAQARGLGEALRAADVVLAGGGFELLVLDRVGAHGRVPDSAWARLARRAEQADACLLVLGERAEAGTFAQVTLRLGHRNVELGPSLLGQITACAEIARAKRRTPLMEAAAGTEIALAPLDLLRRGS